MWIEIELKVTTENKHMNTSINTYTENEYIVLNNYVQYIDRDYTNIASNIL